MIIATKEVTVLTMDALEQCFETAKDLGYRFVGILIEMDGFSNDEMIINPIANADKKLVYLKKTYDENLNHISALGIKIVGYAYGDTACEVQRNF